jgi:hypothetical protein
LSTIEWRLPDTLQALYDYWRRRRGVGPPPPAAAMVLADIPAVAPHLLLLEVIGAGEDFRYRHSGAALIEAVGVDYTGRRMSEALEPGPYHDYVLGINREVVMERRPLYAESSFRSHLLSRRWTSRLILPLCDTGAAVTTIIAAQVFGGPGERAPTQPYSKSAEFEEGVRVLLD